jgi:hypothetical protein
MKIGFVGDGDDGCEGIKFYAPTGLIHQMVFTCNSSVGLICW